MPDMTLEEALSSFNQANALVSLKPSDILSLKKTIYSNNISINDWNAIVFQLQKLGVSSEAVKTVLPIVITELETVKENSDCLPIVSETEPENAKERQVWIQPTDETEYDYVDVEPTNIRTFALNRPNTMVISNYETLTFGDESPNEALVFENSSEDVCFDPSDEDDLTFEGTSEDEDFTFEN